MDKLELKDIAIALCVALGENPRANSRNGNNHLWEDYIDAAERFVLALADEKNDI